MFSRVFLSDLPEADIGFKVAGYIPIILLMLFLFRFGEVFFLFRVTVFIPCFHIIRFTHIRTKICCIYAKLFEK